MILPERALVGINSGGNVAGKACRMRACSDKCMAIQNSSQVNFPSRSISASVLKVNKNQYTVFTLSVLKFDGLKSSYLLQLLNLQGKIFYF